jgi:hypothetical protein
MSLFKRHAGTFTWWARRGANRSPARPFFFCGGNPMNGPTTPSPALAVPFKFPKSSSVERD